MKVAGSEILSEPDASWFWPLLLAALLVLAVGIWLGFKIPRGILTYPDELLTAERAREMLIQGRDSVYFNFQPSFAKPPLQYWLTTLTLPRFGNAATAVRIWPLMYGVLTAIAVGWLAFLIDSDHPWLIPSSVAIFVSCPFFFTEAGRALLDSGLMLFTTVAIGFTELARRRPQWWLGVAIACWLGALQKIPLIFLVWLIIVIVRFSSETERLRLRTDWLIGGVLLAVALVLIWPLIQYAKYGMPMMRTFASDDLNKLFGQGRLGSRPYFEVLASLVATGWAGGSFALAAAMSFLFSRRRRVPALVTEMSILSLAVVILAVIFNFRSVRYVLPIVPSLSVVLAFLLHQLAERSEKMRACTIAFAIVFVLGGFVQAENKMHHRDTDATHEQRVAEKLGALQYAGASTILIKEAPAKRDLLSNGFYLFYGASRFPLKRYSVDQLRQSPPAQPLVGVCVTRDFPAVRAVYPDVQPVFTLDEFICWQTVPQKPGAKTPLP